LYSMGTNGNITIQDNFIDPDRTLKKYDWSS
jgi:hypothetical protein